MIFRVKWGIMQRQIKNFEPDGKSPLFYFEDDIKIIIYQPKRNYILSSSILKESIPELESFKIQFISRATELLEKPKDNILVIRQE